jgi:MFS family permease
MNPAARRVQRTYLTLLLFNTLAASFIWGINTLFLLDAGLSNAEAFAANAFFTAGMLLFEVPTGVVADLRGRRLSYLLGAVTLAISTVLYLYMWQTHAAFWAWAVASMLLGLGFTFFSGAVEAWLVDALKFTKFTGKLESVFARGQVVQGVAMLAGSVAGGALAQVTNLGVPYIVRAAILGVTFVLAFCLMKDLGFKPAPGKHPIKQVGVIVKHSIDHGLRRPAVRWVLLMSPFTIGVISYGFYAAQPYLLELWGDEKAYGVAGLAAAVMAGAQIAGGLLAPYIGRLFKRRTSMLLFGTMASAAVLFGVGLAPNFWMLVGLLVLWGLLFAAITPVRSAYLNGMIPSEQRATVLSFDSLLGSAGGVATQPAFGKAADVWSYGTTYMLCAATQALALPFAWLAGRHSSSVDVISGNENPVAPDKSKSAR